MFGGPLPRFAPLTAEDGTTLRTAVWDGPETPRGSIVLLQGRTEFIEKYCETAGDLIARGFAVYSLDWRGQGASDRALADPHKGHVRDYDAFLNDLDRFLETVVLPQAPKPIVVLAHSMGGHIALRHLGDHAARGRPYFAERVALSAPMVGILFGPVPPAVVRVLSRGAMLLGLGERSPGGYSAMPFDNNPLTSDRGRFDRNEAMVRNDPRLALGLPTFRWLSASFRSSATLQGAGYPEGINTPILLVSAAADKVVSNDAQKRLAARLPDCRLESVPGSRHEPMMEKDAIRQAFWAHFDKFVGVNPTDRT